MDSRLTRVLVTGMSGTGKSSALRALAARGTGPSTPTHRGCKSNQGRFYPRFHHIVLLSAPAAVLLARIAARTDNPYVKSPAERAEILANLAAVKPLLRTTCTLEIDATVPLDDVVRQLEALIS